MIIISSFIFAFAVIILGSLRKTFFEDERQPDYVLGAVYMEARRS